MLSMKRQSTLICGAPTRCQQKKNETNSKLASSLSLLHAVLFLELVHASAGIYQLLLAEQATRNQMRVMLNNMYK